MTYLKLILSNSDTFILNSLIHNTIIVNAIIFKITWVKVVVFIVVFPNLARINHDCVSVVRFGL